MYKNKYSTQKAYAKQRGIDWQFTYDEWIAWWGDDIINRGPKKGQLVMARNGDTGPYHPSNVRKATCAENNIEAHQGKKASNETKEKMSKSRVGKSTGKRSPETREKMRLAHLGKKRKPHSPEVKEKLKQLKLVYWENKKKEAIKDGIHKIKLR